MQKNRRSNKAYEEENMGGIDLPQAFPDDTPRKVKVEGPQNRKQKNRAASSASGNRWIVSFVFVCAIVVVAAYFLVAHHEKVQLKHFQERIIHDEVEPLSRKWKELYTKLQEENEQLKSDATEYATLKEENDKINNNKANQDQDTQISYLTKYKKTIQENIQHMSKTLLLEKFGPGPHRVEINLSFHSEFPKNEEDGSRGRVVIEMAPVEDLPHVVYFFLEQVTHKLYDGCSFHRNAGHVVQGGPTPNFLSQPDAKLPKRFKDAGFYSILFQEYSTNFPHKKYTLGFAGRPGGPDFYVSTRDNSKLHGPGGQTSYNDPTEADSCFAKVIEGFAVVDRMQLGPLKPGNYKALKNNVAITSMRILGSSE